MGADLSSICFPRLEQHHLDHELTFSVAVVSLQLHGGAWTPWIRTAASAQAESALPLEPFAAPHGAEPESVQAIHELMHPYLLLVLVCAGEREREHSEEVLVAPDL